MRKKPKAKVFPKMDKPKLKPKPAKKPKKKVVEPAEPVPETEPEPPAEPETEEGEASSPSKKAKGKKPEDTGGGPVCKNCEHGGEKHYGSPARWCNHGGCTCQGFE